MAIQRPVSTDRTASSADQTSRYACAVMYFSSSKNHASPIASSTYPMALVYDSDHDLTGQLVITTSLFCCFTLFLWIFLCKQLGLF